MEPIHVIYMGGESRDDPDTAVDYMRADVPYMGAPSSCTPRCPPGKARTTTTTRCVS